MKGSVKSNNKEYFHKEASNAQWIVYSLGVCMYRRVLFKSILINVTIDITT